MFDRLQEAADTGGIRRHRKRSGAVELRPGRRPSAFGDNCATCHGAGGQGFIGYPNLNDDVWLWGGSFDDIRHTLHVGIRWEDNPDTRFSQMPAYGRDELLSREEISAVTDYVMTLSDMIEPTEAGQTTGAEIFEFSARPAMAPTAWATSARARPT
jgi:cytochrome c oxidase cbb3-type subunit 3